MKKVDRSVKIENVVASASLKHGIDLEDVDRAFPRVKYSPEKFPGLVFRLKKPRTAILIFSSGKMVCTGAKSTNQARKALRKVIRKLKKAGIVILGRLSTKIQNVVASASLGGNIDLVSWYGTQRLGGRMMYEPEQFPGLIFRMKNPRAVMLLFSSGKLVCTGAKKEDHVYEAVNRIREMLEEDECIFYPSSLEEMNFEGESILRE
ncbi:MAG: TATA-box-binding protein [Candidatus Korarchaeota archaeon]|nr:TATA-box-binding protein [Candidatus Korarchaeota archaeon]